MKLRGRTFGDFIVLMGGNGASQVINAIGFSLIYARFSDAVAAQYFLVLSQSGVVVTLATLRIEQAALIDLENAGDIMRLSVLLAFVTNLIVFAVHLLVSGENMGMSFQFGLLNFLWTLFGIGVVKLLLEKRTRILSVARLLQSLSFLVLVSLAAFGSVSVPLLLALAMSYLLPVLFLLKLADFAIFRLDFARIRWILSRHRAYVFFDMPSGLISNVTSVIPLWLIAGNYGDGATAAFGFAARVIHAPFNLVSSAVREKYKSDSVGLAATAFHELHHTYERGLALATLPIALIGALAIWLTPFDSTQIFVFSALFVISLFRFNVSSISFLIYVKGRIQLDLGLHLGLLAAMGALWLITSFVGFELFVIAFSSIMALFYVVYKLVINWLLRVTADREDYT
ncbi:MAG: hypothetical protein JJ872_08950 [Marivivens sp.]|nr:hypothetical protein [Marivivens sp.]